MFLGGVVVKKANIIAAIIGMLFSVVAFVLTFTFKHFKNVPVGPEFFPRYLAVGMFICCAVLLLQNLKVTKDNNYPAKTLSLRDKGMQKMLIGVGIVLLYALLWNVLGFLLISPLALFAMMYLVGMHKYLRMGIISIVATVVVFCIFKFLLGIEMPMGILE